MTGEICRFGLIVTGRGEESFLPQFFHVVMAKAYCLFTVIRRVGQRSPITAPRRILRMVGTRQRLPTRDVEEIGLPVRRFVQRYPGSYAMVVDDLEGDRRAFAADVFSRYRTTLDEILRPSDLHARAAVHFLVNMLEAYYFADCQAVNAVAGAIVIPADHPTDVEQIGHPKKELKRLWRDFNETEHGEAIVNRLDMEHVLSRPDECCWLRAMFAWCVAKLLESDCIHDPTLTTAFCLTDGKRASITSGQ